MGRLIDNPLFRDVTGASSPIAVEVAQEDITPYLAPGAEMPKGWIGVDLDGTLAYYDHWRGLDHIGPPVMPMLFRVRRWIAEGREVRIFTARCQTPEAIPYIRTYLHSIGLPSALAITNVKDYFMDELWDDRCCQVVENTGMPAAYSPRGLE